MNKYSKEKKHEAFISDTFFFMISLNIQCSNLITCLWNFIVIVTYLYFVFRSLLILEMWVDCVISYYLKVDSSHFKNFCLWNVENLSSSQSRNKTSSKNNYRSFETSMKLNECNCLNLQIIYKLISLCLLAAYVSVKLITFRIAEWIETHN